MVKSYRNEAKKLYMCANEYTKYTSECIRYDNTMMTVGGRIWSSIMISNPQQFNLVSIFEILYSVRL